ncbi:MAG: flagellar filament capping protein FliD [Armatimonadetes bacterium]|nr:flagellar filament capping protein FliD [Armatimonadota bacterium]
MSTLGSTSGIHFAGLASGIDVDSIISKLIQIESLPVQALQRQQQALQTKQLVYGQLKSQVQSVATALAGLSTASNFNPAGATSSDTASLTVSATGTAAPGQYTVKINKLAQNHKVASSAQTNATDALNLAGTFVVNGKAVQVTASDTLTTIAGKVNALGNGVVASVLNGGTGSAYISFGSTVSGAKGGVQLADATGSVLSSLGVLSGAKSLRESPAANTGLSYGFSDTSSTIGTLTGLTNSGSITISGQAIAIDFSTDTLQAVADKINAAGSTATASVVTSTSSTGATVYKLQLTGAAVPSSITDTNGLLTDIGVLQQGFGNQLVAAQDASITVDNLTLTSSTNQVNNVVPGVTLNLLKDNTTVTVNVTQDTQKISDAFSAFKDAYNNFVEFTNQYSQFDSKTFDSGPLFGDDNVQQIQNSVNNVLFSPNGTGTYKTLTQLGYGLDDKGKLTLDTAKLGTALSTDLQSVKNLMVSVGSSTNANITYVSSTDKTLASGTTGYAVNITRVATKGQFTGGTAQTLANAGSEQLTFGGSLFGSTNVTLYIDSGSSASDLVSKINADTRLKDNVVASLDGGGKLVVTSKRYGTTGNFTLVSNQTASASNSGVGTGSGTMVDGVDVAGTINGESAAGNGQYLIANSGNTNTSNLQIQYSGSTTGSVGSIVFNKGLSSTLNKLLSSYTDSTSGRFKSIDDSIQAQIDDMTTSITQKQSLITLQEDTLRKKFTAMETALSSLQAQSTQLSTILKSSSSG